MRILSLTLLSFLSYLIALSAAGASFGGGVVYANYGFPSLNGIGAFLTLIPLILTLWWSLVYQKRIKNRI